MKALVMLAAVVTSALLLIPTVATAQTATTAIVSYHNLDLSTAAGREKLDARLDRTIEQLCAEPGMRGVGRLSMERACVASARSSVASFRLALNGRARAPRG